MAKYEFLVSVSNTGGTLSKEHYPTIEPGTVIDFAEVPERIKQFEKIGIVKPVEDEIQDPADPGQEDPDQLPDGYNDLKKLADDIGVEYVHNISKKDLIEKIQEKQAEKE